MKRSMGMTLIVGGLLVAAAGCSTAAAHRVFYPHAQTETLGQTAHEHERSVARIAEHDRRALAEDLDLLFLTDRATRLTRWHSR